MRRACPRLRLVLRRHGIQHVGEPRVPAALCGRGRLLRASGRPDAHIPIAALVHRHGFRPRACRSRSIAPHDAVDARGPLSTASTIFGPWVRAPLLTSRAALVSSSPTCPSSPSAQTDTPAKSASRRRFHPSYSSCQGACRRLREAGDRGAASPNRPRRASSQSPHASPCRDRVGRSAPTSRVRRVNSGQTRLTNRSCSPRTRGRRTVLVPAVQRNRRGVPSPVRIPVGASTALRRAAFGRPSHAVPSASRRV
jgi:hypothetical protein